MAGEAAAPVEEASEAPMEESATTVGEGAVETSDTDDDPPAVKASSDSVLLMQMLSRFDLEDDLELLAHQGIKRARDLEYLDKKSIGELSLNPIIKAKLRKIAQELMNLSTKRS